LHALLLHLLFMTRPDGTVPNLGDDDGGRSLQLDARAPNDVRSLFAIAASMLGNRSLRLAAKDDVSALTWLLGPGGLAQFDHLTPEAPTEQARSFEHGGLYVTRSGWSETADWLVIDCGPHGSMNCGHAHADALAVELALKGKSILVDAGTCTYVGRGRDEFRSTAAHNTVTIDDASSSDPAASFSWRSVAECRADRWIAAPRFTAFAGHHTGFARLPGPARHRRELMMIHDDYLIVRDLIESREEHDMQLRWHIAPTLEAQIEHGFVALRNRAGQMSARLLILGTGDSMRIEDGWVAPVYGQRVAAPVILYSQRNTGTQETTTFILPDGSASIIESIRAISAEGGHGFRIERRHGVDVLLYRAGELMQYAGASTDAAWLWLRLDHAGSVVEFIAIEASCLTLADQKVLALGGRRQYEAGRLATAEQTDRSSIFTLESAVI
jgi:hypothetical protein